MTTNRRQTTDVHPDEGTRPGGRRLVDGGRPSTDDRVVVLNPASGSGEHAERVRDLAAKHGFSVRETAAAGDAIDFAAEAARDGASLVAAAGGDGTLNEVVRGLVDAGALDDVCFGVVPAGTGNNFAENVGIESVPAAFEVIEHGDERIIDLGFADGRPFLNSCVGGLTAEASEETSSEDKAQLGVMAYVLNTVHTAVDFEGMEIHVETTAASGQTWEGSAVLLLIGNGRRFPVRGRTQADMEDGLLDVAIVEENPGSEFASLARSAALERLLGSGSDTVTRLQAPELTIHVGNDDAATFSLDGQMISTGDLDVETRADALRLRVGDQYEPHPEA